MLKRLDRTIHAVTFDCWGTLLSYDPGGARSRQRREEALWRAVRSAGGTLERDAAGPLLQSAWNRHNDLWKRGQASGSPEMARWALESAGVRDEELGAALALEFSEAALDEETPALPGARDTLAALAGHGVRLALISDTGYTPGRVVRKLLDRVGLLEWLEVLVFSDETGVPKPDARVFHAALDPLETPPEHGVHVGDLLRTDIAGARAIGMGSIRIRELNDDDGDLPEADAVADSHAHLQEILGVR